MRSILRPRSLEVRLRETHTLTHTLAVAPAWAALIAYTRRVIHTPAAARPRDGQRAHLRARAYGAGLTAHTRHPSVLRTQRRLSHLSRAFSVCHVQPDRDRAQTNGSHRRAHIPLPPSHVVTAGMRPAPRQNATARPLSLDPFAHGAAATRLRHVGSTRSHKHAPALRVASFAQCSLAATHVISGGRTAARDHSLPSLTRQRRERGVQSDPPCSGWAREAA